MKTTILTIECSKRLDHFVRIIAPFRKRGMSCDSIHYKEHEENAIITIQCDLSQDSQTKIRANIIRMPFVHAISFSDSHESCQ